MISSQAIAGPSRSIYRRTITSTSPSLLTRPTRTSIPYQINGQSSSSFSTFIPLGDKIKSHSGAKKRFWKTATGLFKRAQAGKQHLNTLFSASRINRLGQTAYTTKTQAKMLRKMLPHS